MTSIETTLNPDETAASRGFWDEHGMTSRTYRCHSRGQALKAAEVNPVESLRYE